MARCSEPKLQLRTTSEPCTVMANVKQVEWHVQQGKHRKRGSIPACHMITSAPVWPSMSKSWLRPDMLFVLQLQGSSPFVRGVLSLCRGVLLSCPGVLLSCLGVLLPRWGVLLTVIRRTAPKHFRGLPFFPFAAHSSNHLLHSPCKDFAWSICQNFFGSCEPLCGKYSACAGNLFWDFFKFTPCSQSNSWFSSIPFPFWARQQLLQNAMKHRAVFLEGIRAPKFSVPLLQSRHHFPEFWATTIDDDIWVRTMIFFKKKHKHQSKIIWTRQKPSLRRGPRKPFFPQELGVAR